MNKVELLAPAGDLLKLKTALLYGADAVFVGGKSFSLRAKASNFSDEDLIEGVRFAHSLNKKVHVTVNVITENNEIEKMKEYVRFLSDIGVDAIIVSSPAIMKFVKDERLPIEIHVSTQCSSSNSLSVDFYKKLGLFLFHTVGQSGGGGLVDDTQDLQAGDLAGVLGGLTLSVGKVSGNGNDGLAHLAAQISFGVSLQLLQHHGGDLLGGVLLAVDVHLVVGAHLTLDGSNGAGGVGDALALGHLAHHALAGLGESDNGGSGAGAFGVGDDDGLAALDDGDAGVGCTQIDTNDLRHSIVPHF